MPQNRTTNNPVTALRQKGGFCRLESFGLVKVTGKDAASYLQGRTTNDVIALKPGDGQLNTLLNPKAHVQAIYSLHRADKEYWLVAENDQIQKIVAELEKFIFAEKVEVADCSDTGQFWTVQGPNAIEFLESLTGSKYDNQPHYTVFKDTFWNLPVTVIRRSITGENGYFLFAEGSDFEALVEKLESAAIQCGMSRLSADTLEKARVEAGYRIFGKDVIADDFLPETGLDKQTVSYTKGCYQGQETVARMNTYGGPPGSIVGLVFESDLPENLEIFSPIQIEGSKTGELRSYTHSPTLDRTIAIAKVSRQYRVPEKSLSIEIRGTTYDATVKHLPFYTPPTDKDRANDLYNQALKLYADSAGEKEAGEAVSLLRTAIKLNPAFGDAYESLGVILSKLDELEEAIALMKQLSELDPESIMAHTNLSIFYMEQGDKEKAEEEKAEAMSIQMNQIAKELKAQKDKESDLKQKVKEAEERKGMFEQVLEIDPDDLLANYGLGNLYVELAEFSEAIPYLKKALEVNPGHTVAYLALGKALQELGEDKEALEIYTSGIEVAAKRGDMMPMQEMQNRQAALSKN